MSEVPTLSGILSQLRENAMRSLRVCGPAKVTAYDASTQKCSVQPLIHEGVLDDDGERHVERLPVITNVPVIHFGGGGFQITVPVVVGDTVLVVYSDRSLDRWLVRGGEVDPDDDRAHDLSDAIAITGLRDFAHALASAPTDRIRIGNQAGDVKIDITSTEIQAGGSAALAKASDLTALKTAITNAVIVPMDGGESFQTTLLAALTSWPNPTTVLKGG